MREIRNKERISEKVEEPAIIVASRSWGLTERSARELNDLVEELFREVRACTEVVEG